MFRKIYRIMSKWVNRLRKVETGPDSKVIPFYGTHSFEMGGNPHLDNAVKICDIFEKSNIYFVRTVGYELGKDGSFQLYVDHFEDGMLSTYTYRLNCHDAEVLEKEFRDEKALQQAFGSECGGDDFLKYCAQKGFNVDYVKYWR